MVTINKLKILFLSFFPNLDSEKERISWAQMQIKKIPKGENIIDIGAGEMLFKKYCRHLLYTSQDLSKYEGIGNGEGIQTKTWNTSGIDIISDISDIPVRNSIYNNVLCTAVLEHVPYPELAIKEIGRILKKGGKLILDAPFCSQTHFPPLFYTTGFSSNWYKLILAKYRLKIIKLMPYGNYFNYISQELLRTPLVVMKYSSIGVFSYVLYILLIPLVIIFEILSKLSNGSEKQLCFGYHVLAKRI